MDPFSVLPLTLFGGQYRVIRPLGQGGMGSVYEVEQVSTGARRALKVLHRHLLADQKLVARFVQEARIGANIPSDHVVSVLDAGVDETTGRPYLVMELLLGQGLDAVLAETPRLGPADVLEIVRQLCHALGSAHAGGIVHRDVKPSNVFLCESRSAGGAFTVKVLDFGIAKLTSDSQSTQAIGTPKWMAPEQAYAAEVTPAADIWPLGLLVFRMLTGASYWRGSNAVALMRESLLEEAFAATARAAELGCGDALPSGFEAWFQTCLARAPEDRYANASLAFEALCPLLEQVSEGKLPELVIHARPVTLRPSYGIPTSPLLPLGLRGPAGPRNENAATETRLGPFLEPKLPRDVEVTAVSLSGASTPADRAPEASALPAAEESSSRGADAKRPRWATPVVAVVAGFVLVTLAILIGFGLQRRSAIGPAGRASASSASAPLVAAPPSTLSSAGGSTASAAGALPATPRAHRANVLASVRRSGTLRVGVEDDAPPLNYIDAQTHARTGFDYELIVAVAKKVGIARVEAVEGKFDSLPQMLADDKVDIFMSGWVPDPKIEHEWGIAWSDPYLSFGYCLIVRKGSAIRELSHLAGRNVAIYKGDGAIKSWVTDNVRGLRVLSEHDGSGWFRAATDKGADAIVYDYPFALEEIRKSPDLRIVALNLNAREYAIGLPSHNPDMLDEFNRGLAEVIGTDWYRDLIKKYMKSDALDVGAVPQGSRRHVVKKGETWSSIARDKLGDAKRSNMLWELNKSRIPHPSLLVAGDVIVLP